MTISITGSVKTVVLILRKNNQRNKRVLKLKQYCIIDRKCNNIYLYSSLSCKGDKGMNILLIILNLVMLILSIIFTLGYARVLAKLFKVNERLTKVNDIAALTVLLMCIILI